jgi:hypothetical protein
MDNDGTGGFWGFQVVTSLQPQIYREILKGEPLRRSLQAVTGRHIFLSYS